MSYRFIAAIFILEQPIPYSEYYISLHEAELSLWLRKKKKYYFIITG